MQKDMLFRAVKFNSPFMARPLLENSSLGVELEAKDEGNTALLVAVVDDKTEMVRVLLELGADVDATYSSGETSLHNAAAHGQTDILRLLVERTAAINAQDQYGKTALHKAVASGQIESVRLLVEHGADVDARSSGGVTALNQAAEGGQTDIVRLLLESGADVNGKNKWKDTALHEATCFGKTDVVRVLLEHGADVHGRGLKGNTALHNAANCGDTESVRLLLKHGADMDARNEDESLVLHKAAHMGNVESVRLLLARGADVDAKDKFGNTALHWAQIRGKTDIVRHLLGRGAGILIKGNDGRSTLSMVIQYTTAKEVEAYYATARALCEAGAPWDEDCNRAGLRPFPADHTAADGIRACVRHWTRQRARGPSVVLTHVQIENVKQGKESVETYLKAIAESAADEIVRRRKLCVIGPSCSGKTSLVKSLQALKTTMVDVEDRTIGIDLFALDWEEPRANSSVSKYEATVWDFAGQDVYQVAHTLYFSKRTLYLVVVNMEAYRDQLLLDEDSDIKQSEARISRWVHEHVFCWVQLVLGRQPDAELVIVCSKCDKIDVSTADTIVTDLEQRLGTWATAFAKEHDGPVKQEMEKSVLEFTSRERLRVSIATQETVDLAVRDVRRVVTEYPGRAYLMPRLFTQVLDAVADVREAAAATTSVADRVTGLLIQADTLVGEIMDKIDGLKRRECRDILGTLHALGDILWFEQERHFLSAGSSTIILDPRIMLELVREVVNHQLEDRDGAEYDVLRSHGELRHSLLSRFPMWRALCEQSHDLVLFFKRLLQQFNLAYPVGKQAMAWDSDLIVPSFWKTKKQPSAMEGDTAGDTFSTEAVWQYTVPANVSETIFDQFIVQCHGVDHDRVVSSTGVVMSKPEVCSASISYNEGRKPSEDLIVIRAKADSVEECWRTLEFLVASMEHVLDGYPGLGTVHRHVLRKSGKRYREFDVKRLLASESGDSTAMFDTIKRKFCPVSAGA